MMMMMMTTTNYDHDDDGSNYSVVAVVELQHLVCSYMLKMVKRMFYRNKQRLFHVRRSYFKCLAICYIQF